MGGCATGFQAASRSGDPAFYALLLSGGDTPRLNYLSHAEHIGGMHEVLRARGIAPAQITVLMSDGSDENVDLAVESRAKARGAWLLEGTHLERALGRPILYQDTSIPGITALPARREALTAWFGQAGGGLQPRDTLLFFVTDHGQAGEKLQDTSIALWDRQQVTVSELAALVGQLPRGVRVVTVMSQCFSGAFAELALSPGGGRAIGDTCGFFSTLPDRQAYGCTPESRSNLGDGHAFSFIAGLGCSNRLAAAHASTLITDRTGDVPLRSSDVFLARMVDRVAAGRGMSVDQLIGSVVGTRLGGNDEDARLAREVAGSFAITIPSSAGELTALTDRIVSLQQRFESSEAMWVTAAGELAQANLDAFLMSPAGQGLMTGASRRALLMMPPAELPAIQTKFISLLSEFTGKHPERQDLMFRGRTRGRILAEAAARSAARTGALLRLRTLLVSLAGRALFDGGALAQERSDYEALRACENTALPRDALVGTPSPAPRPFPAIEADEQLASTLEPASLGAALTEVPSKVQERHQLPAAAMAIRAIEPQSAASAAGLRPGDILLGGVGAPVRERGALKLYLASLPRAPFHRLDILREGRRMEVRVEMRAGVKAPEAADLRAPGRAALRALQGVRGNPATALAGGKQHLLFFWATWCKPCKLAVPDLLAFEKETGIRVVAISEEEPDKVQRFLGEAGAAGFLSTVAIDADRLAHEAFEVDVLPSFVLVDQNLRVRGEWSGYSEGLGAHLREAAGGRP
jgi:thiol-disulfide isomerase/thioredoxin